MDGYNVCIFAYGQTGSGKTHTMEGTEQQRGVNYRTLKELFEIAHLRRAQMNFEFDVSLVEVYNEEVRDLLQEYVPEITWTTHGKVRL
jgi:kinesin family protein C2/C3